MKLQFFYVKDLCRFVDCILEYKPDQHIFNIGNRETISIMDWVKACYYAAGKRPQFVHVYKDVEQRNYFSFYNYEYYLDVEKNGFSSVYYNAFVRRIIKSICMVFKE